MIDAGVDLGRNNRTEQTEDDIMEECLKKVGTGSVILVNADTYLADHDFGRRKPVRIIGTYPHYVLTVDDLGRRECFVWHDLWMLINGGGVNVG